MYEKVLLGVLVLYGLSINVEFMKETTKYYIKTRSHYIKQYLTRVVLKYEIIETFNLTPLRKKTNH